jgi:hypothetical protein
MPRIVPLVGGARGNAANGDETMSATTDIIHDNHGNPISRERCELSTDYTSDGKRVGLAQFDDYGKLPGWSADFDDKDGPVVYWTRNSAERAVEKALGVICE